MSAKPDPRHLQLGRIHQAAKQLGMDDATYRALLQRVTGKASSGAMTHAERNAVLAEMARLGFKATSNADRKRAYAGQPSGDRKTWRPMVRKVGALLADGKKPWSYAHEMAQRMFHVNRVEWLNDHDLHKLVSALQIDANRRPNTGSASQARRNT
ncbi:gp16 family protein [Luteimonas soli]|uniref:Gp16 family protein n=1 Tax=Luteimonas soli TaxID=1648966 RepID=A0ABV7XPA8_9GAMM